jgi:hypothetical protein
MAKDPISDGRSLISNFIKVGAKNGNGISKNIKINEITPNTEIFTMVLVFHDSLLNVYIKIPPNFYFLGIIAVSNTEKPRRKSSGYKNRQGLLHLLPSRL